MSAVSDRALWQDVLAEVERNVGAGAVEMWLRDVVLVDAHREEVVIAVPTAFARQRIEGRLNERLAGAFESLLGARPQIRVVVDPAAHAPAPAPAPAPVSVPVPVPGPAAAAPSPRPAAARIDEMSLETFVVGPANKVAFRAAERVCESPGDELNPLVVVGATGLGKTHLLAAIARRLREESPRADLLLVTAEDFANQFSAGIRSSQTERFRERYRRADAVLIDDVQQLASKPKTQLEFLHTFEALLNARKQIVVSCEESPKRLEALHPGLRTRLLAGLVVELGLPDLETRRRMLDLLARRHKISLTREVMEFMARNLTRNARDLVGAIARLQAHAAIGERVDVPLAKRRLGDLLGPKVRVRPEELLLEIVAERCGVPADDLRQGSRRLGAAQARQIAMFLARRLTKLSLTEIGRFFGREPSTVTYAENKIARLLVGDDEINRLVEDCQERFEDRK